MPQTELLFCIFCETGKEKTVEEFLGGCGLQVISSLAQRKVYKKGKAHTELRPLVPGYVFFAAFADPDWEMIKACRHVLYPLRYADGTMAMRNGDMKFVKWLRYKNGTTQGGDSRGLAISKAMQVGNRIKVVDGPLKDYEGSIVKISKGRKCAAIELDTDSIIHTIWLSFELINAETPHRTGRGVSF